MPVKPLPPQDLLLRVLRYDPHTGHLFWRDRPDLSGQWNGKHAGKAAFTSADRRGYRHGKIDGLNYQAHRIIWKMAMGVDPEAIDHINNDPSDNRLANLRACTTAENSRNYAKTGAFTSRFRGVCWVIRDQKWAASISVKGRKISLGHHDTQEAAAVAYDAAATKHHGAFAVLNFPAAQADYTARILSALKGTP